MNPAPAALVAMLIVVFVPGALLFRTLQPRGRALECVAMASILSLALTVVGQASTVAGLPFNPVLFSVVVFLVGATAVLRYRREALKAPVLGIRDRGARRRGRPPPYSSLAWPCVGSPGIRASRA